jgi:rare lipoprotein A
MKIFLSLIVTGCFVSVFAGAVLAQAQTGKASFYADSFEGKTTANGEKYRASKLTAAHRTLPLGTVVKVTNLANHEEVNVTINDRGPYAAGRIIDLSKAAAEKLKFITQGTAEVKIEIVDARDEKSKSQPVADEEVTVTGKEFYDFETSKISPKGFGVQVGAYQELVNLFRTTDDLKKSYKKKVVVQVKMVGGVKYYSLILGSFSSREKAENFASGLKKQFPDVFVLDYSNP